VGADGDAVEDEGVGAYPDVVADGDAACGVGLAEDWLVWGGAVVEGE
jgi:hypothetical protein